MIQWSQGDANPVVNTVTTCGMPPGGGSAPPGGGSPVCDTDQHSTTIVPPATPTQPAPPASPNTRRRRAEPRRPRARPPQIAVSPVRVRPGSATLRGPSGCPTTSAVAATVTGRRIVKVTFYVDGKKVKTLTQPNKSGGRWVLPMNVKRFAFGSHRVQARIAVRALQPDQVPDAADELQPLPSGQRQAQVHGLTPRPRSRSGSPGCGRGTPSAPRGA